MILLELAAMFRKLNRNVIIASIILIGTFIGLGSIFAVLIDKSITANRVTFINLGKYAVSDIGNDIQINSPILKSLDSLSLSNQRSGNNSIDSSIQKMITTGLTKHNLIMSHTFGIYFHDIEKNDSIRYITGSYKTAFISQSCLDSFNIQHPLIQTSFHSLLHKKNTHYHLVIHLVEYKKYLFAQIKPLLTTAILLGILLIFSFLYFIRTIHLQRKASQIKDDFINNLTHEFKTPLFSIDLATSFLKDPKTFSEERKVSKYASIIEKENEKLKNHVDKILQIALIDSNNFKLEKQEKDVHPIILNVLKSFELLIEKRNGNIHHLLFSKLSTIEIDETHFRNTVYNLIDNAIKYSPNNPLVTLSTKNEKIKKNGKIKEYLVLEVSDNGIGIPPEKIASIFEKFYRAESGNIHTVKGFGLGLSYVKSIMTEHGGMTTVKSIPGKGSTFSLFFPLNK